MSCSLIDLNLPEPSARAKRTSSNMTARATNVGASFFAPPPARRPSSTQPQPSQPIIKDDQGVMRFRENAIVVDLLKLTNLNQIAAQVSKGEYSKQDYIQLMQLIGYSVSGFGDLSMVPKSVSAEADEKAAELLQIL